MPQPSSPPGAAVAASRFADNPFYVLELPVTATRMDVERAAQRLLAMLELGMSKAADYPTPLGDQPRTVDKVRHAAAELRDPERRLQHELWAHLEPRAVAGLIEEEAGLRAARLRPWAEALSALGWASASAARRPKGAGRGR